MYLMGIINSRRLGKSLGLDIVGVTEKKCNLQCVYCECGNGKYFYERESFVNIDEVIIELKAALITEDIDIITFSGLGEPTLSSDLGKCIDEINKITDIPVCVITNSTLINNEDVRNALKKADIVMPSIDAVTDKIFNKIDRPHKSIDLTKIIQGLIEFSKEYKGKLYLESFLVKGINDSEEDLDKLIETVKKINPTELHLNTVDRVPAEKIEIYDSEINDIFDYVNSKLNITVKLF